MDTPPIFSGSQFALPNDPMMRAATEQQTYDFSAMYTQLQLAEMKNRMEEYATMVFGWAKDTMSPRGEEKILLVHKNGIPKWLPISAEYGDTNMKKVITPERFKAWVNYLLDNLYVEVGDKVLRQIVGIPMGVSCAPYLANLMLFMYEYNFITAFIAKHDPLHNPTARSTLWKLSCCTRYIDDLWNPLIKKSLFQKFTKEIYPDWLPLGDPEYEGASVHYLDMTIRQEDGIWHSNLYDKRVSLRAQGLKTNKFPHPESKLTTRCKYGVITSQLHRFSVACSKTSYFLEAATALYTEFMNKGYQQKKIDAYCHKFLTRNAQKLALKPTAVRYRYEKQQAASRA